MVMPNAQSMGWYHVEDGDLYPRPCTLHYTNSAFFTVCLACCFSRVLGRARIRLLSLVVAAEAFQAGLSRCWSGHHERAGA